MYLRKRCSKNSTTIWRYLFRGYENKIYLQNSSQLPIVSAIKYLSLIVPYLNYLQICFLFIFLYSTIAHFMYYRNY